MYVTVVWCNHTPPNESHTELTCTSVDDEGARTVVGVARVLAVVVEVRHGVRCRGDDIGHSDRPISVLCHASCWHESTTAHVVPGDRRAVARERAQQSLASHF